MRGTGIRRQGLNERRQTSELTSAEIADLVMLGRQTASVIRQSNVESAGGLKTAGEMLTDWLRALPVDVRVELGLGKTFVRGE